MAARGGRIVIPRTEVDAYLSVAEAAQAVEPLPDRDEIVDEIRAGRRRFVWPQQGEEQEG